MTDKTLIDKLWDAMRAVYGRATWQREHGDIDDGTWAKAMAKFHPRQIFSAVASLEHHYPSRPPTLWQFRDLCRQQTNPEAQVALPKPHAPADPERRDAELERLRRAKGRPRRTQEAQDSGEWTAEMESEYQKHARLLGLDAESLRDRNDRRTSPDSPGACRYPGCCRIGALSGSTNGGGLWWCRDHLM